MVVVYRSRVNLTEIGREGKRGGANWVGSVGFRLDGEKFGGPSP